MSAWEKWFITMCEVSDYVICNMTDGCVWPQGFMPNARWHIMWFSFGKRQVLHNYITYSSNSLISLEVKRYWNMSHPVKYTLYVNSESPLPVSDRQEYEYYYVSRNLIVKW